MQKKLTITIDAEVYEGLYRVVGPRRISRFIEDLARPHVTSLARRATYAEMARDEEREAQALEWADGRRAHEATTTYAPTLEALWRDLSAWERERARIRQWQAQGRVAGERIWRREELHER